jgi:D-inositol-3-phosphate glycosyltransferase
VSDAGRRLRVLLVSANFRPSVGGIERYVEILGRGLAERGHDVTVLTATRGDEAVVDGLRIVRVPASGVLHSRLNVPYPLPEPFSLTRELRRLVAWADIVNPNDALYGTTLAALAIARTTRTPSVLTQHVAFVPQQHRLLDMAQQAAIQTIGRCARLAKTVVTYNPAVAEWVERTWGVHDVRVVAPGVPEAPQVDRAGVRRDFGLPPDRFVALFVGRDVPKKGLDVFLAAHDPAYELVAVTDRAPWAAPKGASILPFVQPERFRELLSAVDAFVLPSEGEGFPLALQEALVTGVPCVVTRGVGYDHYVDDDEVAFVRRDAEQIRDALRRLVADSAYRVALAERARSGGSREFGVGKFVDAYEQIYREPTQDAQPIPVRP